MNPISLLAIAAVALAVLFFTQKLITQTARPHVTVAGILGIILLSYQISSPAIAAPKYLAALAAEDSSISEGAKKFEEELNVSPTGNEYVGIEYAPEAAPGQKALSDKEIQKKIQANTSDKVVVAVNNGSVRLSGKVENQKAARELLEEIKEIPGVHEITFDLGLEKRSI